MPSYTVDVLKAAHGGLAGQTVVVLGAAYRGGVKETAFSGIFATVESLKSAGANVLVHDPMYTDDELAHYGFSAYHLGDSADALVVQANHEEYKSVKATDFPGIRTVVDGRKFLDSSKFAGVNFITLGVG
jgi:UDP-N-acetyl-D-mannosaminuronate dehydrogenase